MILPLLLIAAQSGSAEPPSDEIVVVASSGNACRVRFADKAMSDAEFDARAAEWKAGKPVRVIARANADFPCLRKIAGKLFDKGVTQVEFVDPQGKPAQPFASSANLPLRTTPGLGGGGSDYLDLRSREHGLVGRMAAQLILQGKCGEARKLALEQGDLDAAASVVQICRAP